MLTFTNAYEQNFDAVYRASLAFCGDPDVAFDATQTSFEKAFVRWGRLGDHPWLQGWLVRTAMNECRRLSRKRSSVASLEAVGPIRAHRSTEGPYEDDHVDIVRSLRALPYRQREATVLFYLVDLSIPAVAELMQLSEGAVRAHLAQSRRRLRGALAPPQESTSLDSSDHRKVRRHGSNS